jgi:hypothetical protein
MVWTPTFDTGLGAAGLIVTSVGLWVSWRSLKEAELAKDEAGLAKDAANNAETAAKDARDSVRREDRKAMLITKLTQLLSRTDSMRADDVSLSEAQCEPKMIELRRDLVACAGAAAGNYDPISISLKLAAVSLDDIDGQRVGDGAEVIVSRKRLLIELGNTISEAHSELELGTHDNGK